ncbi:histidine kinase [Streptomyces sp. WMMC500]|uniref:sensor histidine kinase n=1 Tax=Streptomyces sp. WMMC500 TaxID=3015154 RepID=UPI00248C3EC4|nr:histidine kinase [Streptomyces sp. WMMC500]WBB59483.1 histidine kinase [Streptomyces sp. WMMC500]
MPSPIPVQGRFVVPLGRDIALAAAVAATAVGLALRADVEVGAHRPDPLGWVLLVAACGALAWRRPAPMLTFAAVMAFQLPYHGLQNIHSGPVPATVVAVYSLAFAGPRLRTALVVGGLHLGLMGVLTTVDMSRAMDLLGVSGWVIAVGLFGEAARVHRNYLSAIVERAERAERTREETAARRVVEERLRIARDLHDLLAHSITLVGVQTSVAAHLVVADPDRLDRKAVAEVLEGIAGTCRHARAELRTTLQVLRAGEGGKDATGPLPGLAGLDGLAEAAQAGGARVELAVAADLEVPQAVGAAAYRIVQQSLTNAVQHAGPGVRVQVEVRYDGDAEALSVRVTDDGPAGCEQPLPPAGPRREGFGIAGMRERARSVGGLLTAGRRPGGSGFAVAAVLPCGREADE